MDKMEIGIKKTSDDMLQMVYQLEHKEIVINKIESGKKIGTHKVTEDECNNLISEFETQLIDVNNTLIRMLKQFPDIYNIYDEFHKEWTREITRLIDTTQNIIEDLNDNNIKTKEALSNAEQNNKDIERQYELHKATIEQLCRLKNELESMDHYKDIDSMWSDCQSLNGSVNQINNNVNELDVHVKNDIKKFKNKLIGAYIVSGVSASVAIVGIVLEVLGVL